MERLSMNIMTRGSATHSDNLERWLGADAVNRVSESMRGFYYPIALHGVPGSVYAMPGGDFAGKIEAGQFGSALDRADESITRYNHAQRAALAQRKIGNSRGLLSNLDKQRHAFASLSALVTAATGGKSQSFIWSKTGAASNAIGNSNDLWTRAGSPAAGAAGAAAAGGTAWSSSSTGAIAGFRNASTANTNHFVQATTSASVINNTLLLYDRLFSVAAGAALSGPTNTAVTGVPTRYQSTTSTALDYIGGNFCFPSNPTTVLAATAHNWAVGGGAGVGMTYTNQANSAANLPVATGVSACVVGGIDLAAGAGSWFAPLASNDVGIKELTNMLSSAAVATGTINWVIGHPIAMLPCPIALLGCIVDGVNTAFNLTNVMDSACLGFLELAKPATTATTYSGNLQLVYE